jgi:predicted molibdopterin-dependent oxidoreductase YjgC
MSRLNDHRAPDPGAAAGASAPGIRLTIDGRPVVAPANATILDAARLAGIRIPTLCHHPDLTDVGACRMCVVSVEKARGLQTACTTPVVEGMAVDTQSEEARETRRWVLGVLLSDHPNECMKCEVNGDCELQDLVYEYDVPWPEEGGKRHLYPVDPDPNPFVFIDRNKCIVCTRCVRACSEIQNRDVWSVAGRGFDSKLVTGADQPMLEARCESCGQCVAYCPVGALFDKMSVGRGRQSQVEKVRTTCSYCGVGCNYDLNVRDGRVIRVTTAPDAPVNGLAACVKGRYGYDYVHHAERLTRPLVRRYLLEGGEKPLVQPHASGGPGRAAAAARPPASTAAALPGLASDLVETDWDTALDLVAQRFARIKRESGGDALAVLTSAKCTTEENYLVNKFARQVLGTNNIDHCARL